MSSIAELDRFRDDYRNGLPLPAHQELYEWIAANYPNQNYADYSLIDTFLYWCKPKTVTEMGGWDGAVAHHFLMGGGTGIECWENYEIADVPQTCGHPFYVFHVEDKWLWEFPCIKGDAFIASHVLEHLTEAHLDKLISVLHCPYAYVDVPLGQFGTDWTGDQSTHVLRDSISEFDARWERAGWNIAQSHFSPNGVPSHVRFLERPCR